MSFDDMIYGNFMSIDDMICGNFMLLDDIRVKKGLERERNN